MYIDKWDATSMLELMWNISKGWFYSYWKNQVCPQCKGLIQRGNERKNIPPKILYNFLFLDVCFKKIFFLIVFQKSVYNSCSCMGWMLLAAVTAKCWPRQLQHPNNLKCMILDSVKNQEIRVRHRLLWCKSHINEHSIV